MALRYFGHVADSIRLDSPTNLDYVQPEVQYAVWNEFLYTTLRSSARRGIIAPSLYCIADVMERPSPDTVTLLLHSARQGDGEAFDELFAVVYSELRRLAHVVRQNRAGATLNTTALVHEAYERLVPANEIEVASRAHFFRLAARAMRFVLTDTARRRSAEKRGGDQVVISFDERIHQQPVHIEDVIALDDALTRLEDLDERQAHVVECRFFAGLSVEETAQALGVGSATVKRDWRAARAWLAHELR